jgi:hypothetical protein
MYIPQCEDSLGLALNTVETILGSSMTKKITAFIPSTYVR